jgi:hypothetical protein
MASIDKLISEAMLDLGLSESEFDQPERKAILRRIHEYENELVRSIRLSTRPFKITITDTTKRVRLPENSFTIRQLKHNNSDITTSRVHPGSFNDMETP